MRVRCLPLILPALVAAGLGMSGCAAPPGSRAAASASAEDGATIRSENTNRAIFRFNEGVDHAVLIPAAKAYRTVLPRRCSQIVA